MREIFITIVFSFLMMLSACSYLGPRPIDVTLKASSSLNADDNQRSLPVLVKVYQLDSADRFQNASFNELWHHDIETLGHSLMRQTEFMVKPGSIMNLQFTPEDETKYLGVVAMFRKPHHGSWRVIRSLSGASFSRRKPLQIALNENSVSLR